MMAKNNPSILIYLKPSVLASVCHLPTPSILIEPPQR